MESSKDTDKVFSTMCLKPDHCLRLLAKKSNRIIINLTTTMQSISLFYTKPFFFY